MTSFQEFKLKNFNERGSTNGYYRYQKDTSLIHSNNYRMHLCLLLLRHFKCRQKSYRDSLNGNAKEEKNKIAIKFIRAYLGPR